VSPGNDGALSMNLAVDHDRTIQHVPVLAGQRPGADRAAFRCRHGEAAIAVDRSHVVEGVAGC